LYPDRIPIIVLDFFDQYARDSKRIDQYRREAAAIFGNDRIFMLQNYTEALFARNLATDETVCYIIQQAFR
jgi:hypothetical protein